MVDGDVIVARNCLIGRVGVRKWHHVRAYIASLGTIWLLSAEIKAASDCIEAEHLERVSHEFLINTLNAMCINLLPEQSDGFSVGTV